MRTLINILRTASRILTLRFKAEDLAFDRSHLICGLLCVWVVGCGRYWDNPRVGLLQHLGIGSVVYVFILSAFLFLIIHPMKPARWSYFHLLTFITLTSPPAILYAVPVEKWFSLDTSQTINAWFLAVVALWRVVMYSLYLRRWAETKGFAQLTATLMPLALIVVALMLLNLEQAVFEFMSGIERQQTSADNAFTVVFLLGLSAYLLSPALLILYVIAVILRRVRSQPKPNEAD